MLLEEFKVCKIKKIYCDFDGTITQKDVVNAFYEEYADPSWTKSEDLWTEGKITSKENTSIQVKLLKEVTNEQLESFLKNIELTDGFIEFYNFLKENNIELVILSDGFDYFIKRTLELNGIKDIKIFANHLIYKDNKFDIEFPNENKDCKIGAGMCKCKKIKEKDYCYIGDGTSDLCVAKSAKHLFATKSLYKYCVKNDIQNIYFENFGVIIKTIKKINGV